MSRKYKYNTTVLRRASKIINRFRDETQEDAYGLSDDFLRQCQEDLLIIAQTVEKHDQSSTWKVTK